MKCSISVRFPMSIRASSATATQITAAFGDIEANGHRPATRLVRRRTETRQSFESLASSLGLLAVLPRDVTPNVIGLARDLPLLLVERTLLRQPPFDALAHERLVAADVGRRRAVLEVKHVVDHRGEKRTIVTDEQHRCTRTAEIRLEPLGRLEVEMVRGLVEKQDIGRCDELAREPDASSLTAAERVESFRPRIGRIESQVRAAPRRLAP